MKTLVCTSPGKLAYQEREMPAKRQGYSIIKIKRIGVCGTDLHAFEGTQPFFSYPRVLGHELAGDLVDIDGTEEFNIGEKVTIIPYFNCGECIACRHNKPNCCIAMNVCGVHSDGGMTEFLRVPSYALVHGNELDYNSLALIEPLAIGSHGIQRAGVTAGEYVLVVGAGPIGLGAIQYAKLAGAHVIVLDVNDMRLNFCKEKLGVAHIINGAASHAMEELRQITRGDMPTVVIDATGNLKAINGGFQYLAHGGRYVLIGLQKDDITFNHPEFHKREATLLSSRNATRADFEYVIKSIKDGLVAPTNYITHHVKFDNVKNEFEKWLDPKERVIKAMIEI